MPEYEETLYAQVILGDDADKFFKTDLGRYILGRSEQESTEALTLLKTCDATDAPKIMQLQAKIAIAEAVPAWLNELLIEGQQALQILQEKEV